jgi:hypothetical protein
LNADVFITIVYAGTAVLVALGALLLIVPQVRRDKRAGGAATRDARRSRMQPRAHGKRSGVERRRCESVTQFNEVRRPALWDDHSRSDATSAPGT